MRRPSIAIVGAGRLGSALALCLRHAGYEVAEIISRKEKTHAGTRKMARKVGARKSQMLRTDADLIWLCVPDDQVAAAAEAFGYGGWNGTLAFHSSGVLTSDVLFALRRRGASVASVHPLMTFVRGSVPDLSGVTFAMEGDAPAVRAARVIVRKLKGIPALIRKQDKPAYHAFATMICPLLVALLASAEEAAGLAGISPKQARARMLPIIHQTLRNYASLGPAKAFTGPIVRGDSQTVGRHLDVLLQIPAARNAYVALAGAAREYLPSRKSGELEKLLRNVSLAGATSKSS